MADSVIDKVMRRIEELGDEVFVAKDFWQEGRYDPVSKALSRLAVGGKIKKIKNGVYCTANIAENLKQRDPQAIKMAVLAISRSYGWCTAPHGETAKHFLGLVTEAPDIWMFVTNGTSTELKVCDIPIKILHRNNREISGLSFTTGLVIQVLKDIGKESLDDEMNRKINALLSESEKAVIIEESKASIIWIHEAIKKICSMELAEAI
ncbi:MAG: DUF6088 family protein [Clostridiales bacterium]|jgi:hypothetical protein|nr:DUF6088 family protein [Clostridiales bacterium]